MHSMEGDQWGVYMRRKGNNGVPYLMAELFLGFGSSEAVYGSGNEYPVGLYKLNPGET
jgi:hypothetical protein